MTTVGHIVAVAARDDDVDRLRDHLAYEGFVAEIHEAEPGLYMIEDTSFRDHVRRLRGGLGLGLAIGATAGAVIVAGVPALREATTVVQLLVVCAVALQGTIPTMMWRMSRVEHFDDDPQELRPVAADELLVVLDAEHREARARGVLRRHHATFVTDEHPLAAAA